MMFQIPASQMSEHLHGHMSVELGTVGTAEYGSEKCIVTFLVGALPREELKHVSARVTPTILRFLAGGTSADQVHMGLAWPAANAALAHKRCAKFIVFSRRVETATGAIAVLMCCVEATRRGAGACNSHSTAPTAPPRFTYAYGTYCMRWAAYPTYCKSQTPSACVPCYPGHVHCGGFVACRSCQKD
eukprot:354742-Chlamydomonas_euryale.AAC.5